MKLIYVASPYDGDVEANLEYAEDACRFVVNSGHAFFAPHLFYPWILGERLYVERQLGIDLALAVLPKCDEIWAFGVVITEGMRRSLDEATRLGIPVRHFVVFQQKGKWPDLIQPSMKKEI